MSIVKSIRIQNFKSLEDVTIDLSQLTLLFGANSSGKSSFLKALMFLKRNLYPLNFGKTQYKLENGIDLGSFQDIVIGNDITKPIELIFEFKGKYQFPNEDIFCPEKYSDNETLYEMLIELKNEPFFTKLEEIGENSIEPMFCERGYIDSREYLNYYDLDCLLQFTFEHEENGQNLKRITFRDNSLDTEIAVEGKHTGFNLINPKFFELPFFVKYQEGNFTSSEYENPFEYGFPKELRYANTLFDSRIMFNSITLSDVLSEEFNMNRSFSSGKREYISNEWNDMTDDQKIDEYFRFLQFLYLAYHYVPNALRGFFMSKHLPTTREIPKRKYLLTNGSFDNSDYYGLLNDLNRTDIQEKLNQYLKVIGINSKIVVTTDENVGIIALQNSQSYENLHESSSGTIQLLPILLAFSILRKIGHDLHFNAEGFPVFATLDGDYFLSNFATLFIEQPELHLHPKYQSSFAKVLNVVLDSLPKFPSSFAKESKVFLGTLVNLNIFIETHSEHLIRKLQVLIAKGELAREKVGVWYFKKVNGVTKVEKMEIDENGLFKHDWPDGFFDDSIELAMELFEAVRKRKN